LEGLIEALLDPERGCPWDREQTLDSMTENLLEETYELREALLQNKAEDIKEEGGDLAFILVFIARLTQAKWSWGLKDMLDMAVDKMIVRHPHVFGQVTGVKDSEDVLKRWHQIKRAKKAQGLLASVPVGAPALTRCHRLGAKAARVGFDWVNIEDVRKALASELNELDAEIAKGDLNSAESQERLIHELGDVLMATANLARRLGFSGEKALTKANDRFVRRFQYMENALAKNNQRPEDVTPDELERLWSEAKKMV
jgi:MazG family protein